MSLVTANYNYWIFNLLTKYMSEDNIPQKTLMSDAERKRLRREYECPEEWAIRQEKQRERLRSLRQAQSDEERGKFREYQRKQQVSLRETESEAKQLTAWITSKYTRLPSRDRDWGGNNQPLELQAKRPGFPQKYETNDERMVCLQSRTSTYEKKKTLQSKRYFNITTFHISSEVSDTLVDEQSIGNMTHRFLYCDAKFWKGEKLFTSTKLISKFSLCCGEVKVVLPPLDNLPELLDHLLTSTDTRGKDFRNKIRAHNSSLAFC